MLKPNLVSLNYQDKFLRLRGWEIVKTYHGVATAVWPDGRVQASLLPSRQAEALPQPETRRIKNGLEYNTVWFESKPDAIAWIAKQHERNKS